METPKYKSAVVTGASSGVGRAIACAFAECTERIALVGRSKEGLAETGALVRSEGSQPERFVADFDSRDQLQDLAQQLSQAFGAISLLVHSAAVFTKGSLEATCPEDFDRTLEINLRAPYVLTRALLPALAAGHADVVFMNSSVVEQRRADVGAYAASKLGLRALADSLRQEVNSLGIRVLSIYLGATATPMQEAIYAQDDRHYDPSLLLQADHVATIVRAAAATPRGAEITDIHVRSMTPHRPS